MSIVKIVQDKYEHLGDVDMAIWKFISNNMEKTTTLSIGELALLCNTSRTSILRFSKKIGLSGYAELKTVIRQSTNQDTHVQTDSELQANLINDAILDFTQEDYSLLFERLFIAKRVFIHTTKLTGTLVSQYFKHSFFNDDVLVYPIWGDHEIRKIAQSITEDDLVIFLDIDQETVLLEVLPKLIKSNVFTVTVTHNRDSVIRKLTDFVIDYSVVEGKDSAILFVLVELLHSMYQEFLKGGYPHEH